MTRAKNDQGRDAGTLQHASTKQRPNLALRMELLRHCFGPYTPIRRPQKGGPLHFPLDPPEGSQAYQIERTWG